MVTDPSLAMSKIALEQSTLNNNQLNQEISGHDLSAKFEKYLNPKVAQMDPATLSYMKLQQPDGNMADAVMKSVKGMFKNVNGALDEFQAEVATLEVGKPVGAAQAASIVTTTLVALNYATVSTVATSAVPKTMDTLIKAQ